MRWWELDVSYLTIRAFEIVGLAWDVVRPRRKFGEIAETEDRKVAA
jgi:fatty-acid desaturase